MYIIYTLHISSSIHIWGMTIHNNQLSWCTTTKLKKQLKTSIPMASTAPWHTLANWIQLRSWTALSPLQRVPLRPRKGCTYPALQMCGRWLSPQTIMSFQKKKAGDWDTIYHNLHVVIEVNKPFYQSTNGKRTSMPHQSVANNGGLFRLLGIDRFLGNIDREAWPKKDWFYFCEVHRAWLDFRKDAFMWN